MLTAGIDYKTILDKFTIIESMEVGREVARVRRSLQLNRREMAQAINVSSNTYNAFERGTESQPSLRSLVRVAELAGCTVDDLLPVHIQEKIKSAGREGMPTWDEFQEKITAISDEEKKAIEDTAFLVVEIIQKRLELGITVEDVAKMTGLKASVLDDIENGYGDIPEMSVLKKIAAALGIDHVL